MPTDNVARAVRANAQSCSYRRSSSTNSKVEEIDFVRLEFLESEKESDDESNPPHHGEPKVDWSDDSVVSYSKELLLK
jgi:hypothetical protein